jgi:hypothetical protein
MSINTLTNDDLQLLVAEVEKSPTQTNLNNLQALLIVRALTRFLNN